MTVFEFISMYIMLGCINNLIIMLLLDWVDKRWINAKVSPEYEQVVIGLIYLPITGWVFWSEFPKTWWKQWKDYFDKRNKQ